MSITETSSLTATENITLDKLLCTNSDNNIIIQNTDSATINDVISNINFVDSNNNSALSVNVSNKNVEFKNETTDGTFKISSGITNLIIDESNNKVSLNTDLECNNIIVQGAAIDFTALPNTDPGVAGRLYRDGAIVKISL
jgi:hypothetical protein